MTWKNKNEAFFAYRNNLNLNEMIERLGVEKTQEFLESLTEQEARLLYADPYFTLRTKQIIPDDGREGTLALTSRGFGKNHMGSCWVNIRAFEGHSPILIVGETASDIRDTMVSNNPSSILELAPEGFKPEYFPSNKMLKYPNGSIAFLRSGAEPEQLRGQNIATLFCDEMAKWQCDLDESWSNLMFGLRVGDDPEFLVATTPRSKPLIKQMYRDPSIIKVEGTLQENMHLSQKRKDFLIRTYSGTQTGRQELEGKIIWEDSSALWRGADIDGYRAILPENILQWRIGLDPTTGSGSKRNDEAGIMVVCSAVVNGDKHVFMVSDRTVKGGPDIWANATKDALDAYPKATIIAESNQGGLMVSKVLENAGIPPSKIKLKHHMRSKYERAMPVSLKASQGYIHHVGKFVALEDELTSYSGEAGEKSPNRLDAYVMAIHDLIIDNHAPLRIDRLGI